MGRCYWTWKESVEDYWKTITIQFLKQYWYLDKNAEYKRGWLYWKRNGEDNGNIWVEVTKWCTSGFLRVFFAQTSYDGKKKELDYKIPLVSTPCHYWGVRWWFLCPCKWNRCSTLYLQSNGVFASRKTLDLCYEDQKMAKRYRFLNHCLGINEDKAYEIEKTIKYPIRNGKLTRKARRVNKLRVNRVTMDDLERLKLLLHM